MKRFKWLSIALVLIISMLVSFTLVSCKGETATAEETATTEATTTEAATTEATTTVQEPVELVDVTWISPRGTLDVMDDYNIWVAIEMGYFKELGINPVMEPGPNEALATTKFVSEGQADIGYPSPGVLTSSVDTGMDVIMGMEMVKDQVFNFAVKEDSNIQSVQELAGKTISIWAPGGEVVTIPILKEIGVDPGSVKFVYGSNWGQMVTLGEADAAQSWAGLGPQWDAVGLGLRQFYGSDYSTMPSNGYAIRKSDLNNPEKKELLVKFLRASAMGIEFARNNPRAAAQITYEKFATIREQMDPQLALASMQELHWLYTGSERELGGYGAAPETWNTYLEIIYELGQTKNKLTFEDVATNELVPEINDFDKDRVKADAEAFELNDTWKAVEVVGEW